MDASRLYSSTDQESRLVTTQGDLTSEPSVAEAFQAATDHFGPPNILIANAGITDESAHPPIWEIEESLWDKVCENCILKYLSSYD